MGLAEVLGEPGGILGLEVLGVQHWLIQALAVVVVVLVELSVVVLVVVELAHLVVLVVLVLVAS